MAKTNFKSVDEYITTHPEDVQSILQRVRNIIRKSVPGAQEVISYEMPAYRLPAGPVLSFAGWKKHYSFYGATDRLVTAFKDDLAPYEVVKGTIRFPFSQPVPVRLIERIAKFRAKEAATRARAKLAGRKSKPNAKTIDEYLAALNEDERAALEELRKTIRAAAPNAEECISYQLPAFRLDGKPLVAFGASGNHCAFYPMSGTTVEAHRDELKGYKTSKGTIRFRADSPLSATLVRKLVKARVAENAAQQRHAAHGAARRR